MIIITGAAGFIGSCLVSHLNKMGQNELFLVDDFSSSVKNKNLRGKQFINQVHRDIFPDWLNRLTNKIEMVIHLGARTDTTEQNKELLWRLNTDYSKSVWEVCTNKAIPLIYASSAATYGDGSSGYDDNTLPQNLVPLNTYGESKNEFDKWAISQERKPPFWVGLKFFNVFGPNEYHKGRMASVVYHATRQVKNQGYINLFKSHREDYEDGMQLRDFIYITDILNIIDYFRQQTTESGIYNAGTGVANSFLELAQTVFEALGRKPDIRFIDTPIDIRDNYQYFTCAKTDKLLASGYSKPFLSFRDGVTQYVSEYLAEEKYF